MPSTYSLSMSDSSVRRPETVETARLYLDLGDGVKVNYNKFPHALAKVAGLSEWR